MDFFYFYPFYLILIIFYVLLLLQSGTSNLSPTSNNIVGVMLTYYFIWRFCTLLILLTNVVVIWWCTFLVLTLVFLIILKEEKSFFSIIIYYVVQEFCGLIFLLIWGTKLTGLVLILKTGVAPLHFWVFPFLAPLNNWTLVWFLTLQKLPYTYPLILVLTTNLIYLLVFGLLIMYSQMLIIKETKFLLVLRSMERYRWGLISRLRESSSVYLYLVIYLVSFFLIFNIRFNLTRRITRYEVTFWVIGFPFGLPFYLKVLSLTLTINLGFFLLCFLMGLISFTIWAISFLVLYSSKRFVITYNNIIPFYFLYLAVMLMV